jgi:opacity protein-like surface antigen
LGDSIVGGLLGLQINKMYSVEVRYDYKDTVYEPNNTVKSSSTGIAGVAMFPLKLTDMEPFFIFAKAGYERTKVESTTTDPGIPGFFSPTTTVTTTVRKRVVVGAGAQYDFTRDVSGRIGWNAIGSDHSVYLAAIYKF